ncbi:MAG: hypothetical protein ACPGES_10900 [Coraliomargarita sp.]
MRLGVCFEVATDIADERFKAFTVGIVAARFVPVRGAGNAKTLNALKGPVMKATKGNANPAMLDELLKKLIDEG